MFPAWSRSVKRALGNGRHAAGVPRLATPSMRRDTILACFGLLGDEAITAAHGGDFGAVP
jgi:hypothetical protein